MTVVGGGGGGVYQRRRLASATTVIDAITMTVVMAIARFEDPILNLALLMTMLPLFRLFG